jgi:uroporphyrinogen-III decarboxylase
MGAMHTMTSNERIDAAIALQPVDRVPVSLTVDWALARWRGISNAEYLQNPKLQHELLEELFDEWGGWDGVVDLGQNELGMTISVPMRVKLPGRDLPDDAITQYVEDEIMTAEDYDYVIQNGWRAFAMHAFPRVNSPVPLERLPAEAQAIGARMLANNQKWEDRGAAVHNGGFMLTAFEAFSFCRSLKEFVFDLYRRPEKVIAATEAIAEEMIESGLSVANAMRQAMQRGPKWISTAANHAVNIRPRLFDKFCWPYFKRAITAAVEAGWPVNLHNDGNWTPYLEHFLELPKGRIVVELDGSTDIFKAKQILKGHACIRGDVPPALLSLGTPEEVTAYCRKLIDVVGEGGGFILSVGCTVPFNAKKENVKAIVDTAKTYYPHRRSFEAVS